jgi:hypothetical protein
VVALKPPRIVVVASDGTGFGELRFLLERELQIASPASPPTRSPSSRRASTTSC